MQKELYIMDHWLVQHTNNEHKSQNRPSPLPSHLSPHVHVRTLLVSYAKHIKHVQPQQKANQTKTRCRLLMTDSGWNTLQRCIVCAHFRTHQSAATSTEQIYWIQADITFVRLAQKNVRRHRLLSGIVTTVSVDNANKEAAARELRGGSVFMTHELMIHTSPCLRVLHTKSRALISEVIT